MTPETMRAVVFKGPYKVAVEDRPSPKIQQSTDVIIKVTSTALCGSDLHFYRSHLKCPPGFICGHEFVGEIIEKGTDVKKFNLGDKVVVPFTTACGECFYCIRGQSSQCAKGELFGIGLPTKAIDGGQAEYVRCPFADSTVVNAPDGIPEEMLVLMADIFPTGYFAASRFLKDLSPRDREAYTAVVIGCGPVGICAIASAKTMVKNVIAVDSVSSRLELAAKLGAQVVNLNDSPVNKVLESTGNRGADVVVECVGTADAWKQAFDMIRPWGQISSIGVYTETFPVNGNALYSKNVTMAFGRCPVRSIFEDALKVLVQEHEKISFLCERVLSLEEAPQAYKDFEQRKVHKVVFKVREAGDL